MSTLSLAPVFIPAPVQLRSAVRLTRRGRLVVFVTSLLLALAVAFVLAGGAVGTDEAGQQVPTEIVQVAPGDTLWGIAAWHRADVGQIARWNPRVDPRALRIGTRVLVPGGQKMPPRPTPSMRGAMPTAVPSTRGASVRHRWPLPVKGMITTRFSSRHPGVDIAAPAGTPVRAIAAGTVTWAGWKNNGGGYVVVIRHADGMVSTYNHNRNVAVRRGQTVRASQRIAWVGATGRATGPHLDLRIEMGGRLVNPLRLY